MVLQNVFPAQDPTENICGLFNNGCVGDDIDYPPQAVLLGMGERKGKGGNGFAAAGGHGEGEQSRLLRLPSVYASLQDLTALAV